MVQAQAVKARAEAEKLERQKRRIDEVEKKAAAWQRSLEEGERAQDMFKTFEFSDWNADGIPVKDAAGVEVAKSKRKQLGKELEKIKTNYAKLLAAAAKEGCDARTFCHDRRLEAEALKSSITSSPPTKADVPAGSFTVGANTFPTNVRPLIGKSFASVEEYGKQFN